jgi:cytosine/uracil/thiamine/allantoin permease
MAGGFSIMANVLLGLITFNSPTYEPKAWHSTLFLIGFVIIPVLSNLALRQVINHLETIAGVFHILFFVSFIIMLAVLAKHSTAAFVFRTLLIGSGWNNSGVAFSIGMLTTAFAVGSFDGVLHMSKFYLT